MKKIDEIVERLKKRYTLVNRGTGWWLAPVKSIKEYVTYQ